MLMMNDAYILFYSHPKVLYYETNCFTIWYRRLEKGRYIFQRNLNGKVEMSKEHFKWLLASDKYHVVMQAILNKSVIFIKQT